RHQLDDTEHRRSPEDNRGGDRPDPGSCRSTARVPPRRLGGLARRLAGAPAPPPDPAARPIVCHAGVSEGSRRVSRGNTATTPAARPTDTPHTIRNGAAYPKTSAVTPPSAGPAIEPALVAANATPSASPRFPGGARSETTASAAIQLAAEPV